MTRDGETGIRFLGVDVCKSHLDTFVDGRREQVKRSSLEFERWLRTECRDGVSVHVIVEATAGYEQVVVEACEAVDVACSRVNPNRVKHFARARGRLAKTDRMDAETLALFGEAMRPAATLRPTEAVRELRALVQRRASLVAQRTAEKNRREHEAGEALESVKRHLDWLDGEIVAIDAGIEEQSGVPELAPTAKALRTVPGVGPVVSTTLLALLPELGHLNPVRSRPSSG